MEEELETPRRATIIDAWCRFYPRYLASKDRDLEDSDTIQKMNQYVKSIVRLAKANFSSPSPEALDALSKAFVTEFATIKNLLSEIESLTQHPYWWGDFIHFSLVKYSEEGDCVLLIQDIPMENVYFLRCGAPRLILEGVCESLAQAVHYALHFLPEGDDVPNMIIKSPLREKFRFSPQEFPHHVQLTLNKSSHGGSDPVALLGLPALFSYCGLQQNFDKKSLLTNLSTFLTRSQARYTERPWEVVLVNLGLFITWSPAIHDFAAVNDQKKIELFYLASKLDPEFALHGIPCELFRKIFEDHYLLGSRHKACPDCGPPPAIHGILLKQCCQRACGCQSETKRSLHHEICWGKDPANELWGYAKRMWKPMRESIRMPLD